MESRRLKLGVNKYIGPLEEAWHVEAEGISSSLLRPCKDRPSGAQTSNRGQGETSAGPAHAAIEADGNGEGEAPQTSMREALLSMNDDVDALSSDGEDNKATGSLGDGSPREADEAEASQEEDQTAQQEKRASFESDKRVSFDSEQPACAIPEEEPQVLQPESVASRAGDAMDADSDIGNGNRKQAKQGRRVQPGEITPDGLHYHLQR